MEPCIMVFIRAVINVYIAKIVCESVKINFSPLGIIALILMGSRFFNYLTMGIGFWQEKEAIRYKL